MPNQEDLDTLARSGATLAIHLSVRTVGDVCDTLIPHYGADCPAAIIYRASWPDEQVIRATLGTLAETVKPLRLRRTALILVGAVLSPGEFDDSKLYDSTHFHLLRPKKKRAG